MNFAFAKIGKSIKFKSAYSPTGGDCEAPAFARALALHYPKDHFYLIGRSDFEHLTNEERLKIFPNDNVTNIWTGFKSSTDEKNMNRVKDPEIVREFVNVWFAKHKVRIDAAAVMFGQIAPVNVHGMINSIEKPGALVIVMQMAHLYSGPIVHWLNTSAVPYVEIINDPRYSASSPRDLWRQPSDSLSQYDITYTHRHIRSYEDQHLVQSRVKSRYAAMEVGFLFGRGAPASNYAERTRRFAIVLNEGIDRAYSLPGVYKSRWEQLNLWILSYNFFKDAEVYGDWRYPSAARDPRFKGVKPLEELQQIFAGVRYTLVIPIARGWVTGKYIEMLHAGVLPFFHLTYDDQEHVKIPEYLRVRCSEELQEKIKELDADPVKRQNLLISARSLLLPSYYDGTYIARTVREALCNVIGSK